MLPPTFLIWPKTHTHTHTLLAINGAQWHNGCKNYHVSPWYSFLFDVELNTITIQSRIGLYKVPGARPVIVSFLAGVGHTYQSLDLWSLSFLFRARRFRHYKFNVESVSCSIHESNYVHRKEEARLGYHIVRAILPQSACLCSEMQMADCNIHRDVTLFCKHTPF